MGEWVGVGVGWAVEGWGVVAASYRLFMLGADGRLLVWLWNQLSNPMYG
jgi:hypothetical protein